MLIYLIAFPVERNVLHVHTIAHALHPGNNGRVTRTRIQRNTNGLDGRTTGRMDGRTNEWETVTPNCPSLCEGQVR